MLMNLMERFLRTRWGFGAALVAALLLMLMNELNYQYSWQRLSGGIALTDARSQAAQTLQTLTDAETAVRAYVLSGDPRQFELYKEARDRLPVERQRAFTSLRELNLEQQLAGAVPLTELQILLRKRAATLERLAAQANFLQAGPGRPTAPATPAPQSTRAATDLGSTGNGAPAAAWTVNADLARAAAADARGNDTAVLREAFDSMLTHASSLQQTTRTSLFDAMTLNRITVHLLTLLALVALYLQMRQLQAANNLRGNESVRLATLVDKRTRELRELAGHLVTVREDERGRLARDLHDELGGLFTAMKLDFARMRRQPGLGAAGLAIVVSAEARLNAAIAFKRHVIENLRPSALDQLGLAVSIKLLCQDAQQTMGTSVVADLDSDAGDGIGSVRQLSHQEAELTVYRLVQESLTNIAKYAAASAVKVSVRVRGDQLHVHVQDDGRGFDARKVGQGHHGLLGMRYRVESQGGRLFVHSAPGKGTIITAHLPLLAAAATPRIVERDPEHRRDVSHGDVRVDAAAGLVATTK